MRRVEASARLAALLLLGTLLPSTARASAVQLLVPAYFDPPSGYWSQLTAAAAGGAPITVIINPDSGPGTKKSSAYSSEIKTFQAAGGKVIGYVPTDYDADPASTVEAEIADYDSWYPTINGIFLDEMAGDGNTTELNYYSLLYGYIKGLNTSLQVVGNPGEYVSKRYASVADTLMTYENPSDGYAAQQPPDWASFEPASLFANVVYEVPDVTTMLSDISEAESQNVGYVYFTDDGADGNPYDSLPTYFQAEVAAVPEPTSLIGGATMVAMLVRRRPGRASV